MANFDHKLFMKQATGGKVKLVADLSELQFCASTSSIFHQVYKDTCDMGIGIIGKKDEVEFVVDHVERRDGDLLFYHLVPTAESLQKVPAAKNIEVVLFND